MSDWGEDGESYWDPDDFEPKEDGWGPKEDGWSPAEHPLRQGWEPDEG